MTNIIAKLIDGFSNFRNRYFLHNRELYQHLVKEGQSPKVLVVACADSRVDPAIVLQAEPGDIFSIRNVANVVPPYEREDDSEDDKVSYHGTSAALEFGVTQLGVENIVVFGHAHCAGVKAMISGRQGHPVGLHFVQHWTSIIDKAFDLARTKNPSAEGDELERCCERQSVIVSLENLMTFPFVKERVEAGTLKLHGWYIDIAKGCMSQYDPNSDKFREVDV